MNLYYEITPQLVERLGASYYVEHDVPSLNHGLGFNFKVMQVSNRVWLEDGDRVLFYKHRWEDPDRAIVDMKEFFWVKLRSIPYVKSY